MTTKKPIDATYRVVYFLQADRYVGIAWNYSEATIVTTKPAVTYGNARERLDVQCAARGVTLRYFDGAYECADGETILPRREGVR